MTKIKKQILLKSLGSFGDQNVDNFLDVYLSRSTKEIRPEEYHNDFDIRKRFENERDSSRNFVLYGLINSAYDLQAFYYNAENNNANIINEFSKEFETRVDIFLYLYKETRPATSTTITNLTIESISSDDKIISLTNGAQAQLYSHIPTTQTSYKVGNIFDIKTRKYYIELSEFTESDAVYFFIYGNRITGDVLSTADEGYVNNQIFRQQLVYKDAEGTLVPYGTEDQLINSNGTITEVNNNFPFFYGKHWINNRIEIARSITPTVSFLSSTLVLREGQTSPATLRLNKSTTFSTNIDFIVENITTTSSDYSVIGNVDQSNLVKFNPFSPTGNLNIRANTDSNIEVSESFKIKMNSLNGLELGAITEMTVTILSQTFNTSAHYNFGTIFENNLSFGIPQSPTGFIPTTLTNQPSSLIHGLLVGDNNPNSFYENDGFTLQITNNGNRDTIFPADNGIGGQELLFPVGSTLTFPIINTYNGNVLHAIKINVNIDEASTRSLSIDINGQIYNINIKNNVDLIRALNENTATKNFTYQNIIITDINGDTTQDYVLITSNKPGVPVIARKLSTDVLDTEFSITTDTEFVQYAQNPITLKLNPNDSSGNYATYSFTLSKPGFRDIVINSFAKQTSSTVQYSYLKSSLTNINVPYNNGACTTSLHLHGASINGSLFLFNNVANTSIQSSLWSNASFAPITCSLDNKIGGFNQVL